MTVYTLPTARNRIYNGEAGNLSVAEAQFAVPAGAAMGDVFEFLELLPGCNVKKIELHQDNASGADVTGKLELDDATALMSDKSLNGTTDFAQQVYNVITTDNNKVQLVIAGANVAHATVFIVRVTYCYEGSA